MLYKRAQSSQRCLPQHPDLKWPLWFISLRPSWKATRVPFSPQLFFLLPPFCGSQQAAVFSSSSALLSAPDQVASRGQERTGWAFSQPIFLAQEGRWAVRNPQSFFQKAWVLPWLVWAACRALPSHPYIIKLCQARECAAKAARLPTASPPWLARKNSGPL